MRNHVPILIFLTIFLAIPLAIAVVIGVMKLVGWKPSWQTDPRGFDVKLNTADTAKSTVTETRG